MVEILDTTLREGEQTPGVTFTVNEKLAIATMLDDLGVDFLEVGHPAVSPDVKRAVKAIAAAGLKAKVLAHCRAKRSDIDLALQCDVEWVGLFMSVQADRLKYDFRKDFGQVCGAVEDSVQYAKEHGLMVRYTPEDTVRSDIDTVTRVAKAALAAGADRISIADTVGAATPERIRLLTRRLIDAGATVNLHCHNDLGLALANSLAGYEAGATLIDACVNGLGERTGITSLAELMMALKTHYRVSNDWKVEMLPEISRKVERMSGLALAANAPIVGRNAFSHNAGLHVSAAMKRSDLYEVIPAESVGRRREFAIDKMCGKDLVSEILARVGEENDALLVSEILGEIKSREKGSFTETEIIARAREIRARRERWKVGPPSSLIKTSRLRDRKL